MISSCNCSDVVFKMKYQTEKRHLEEDIPSFQQKLKGFMNLLPHMHHDIPRCT